MCFYSFLYKVQLSSFYIRIISAKKKNGLKVISLRNSIKGFQFNNHMRLPMLSLKLDDKQFSFCLSLGVA